MFHQEVVSKLVLREVVNVQRAFKGSVRFNIRSGAQQDRRLAVLTAERSVTPGVDESRTVALFLLDLMRLVLTLQCAHTAIAALPGGAKRAETHMVGCELGEAVDRSVVRAVRASCSGHSKRGFFLVLFWSTRMVSGPKEWRSGRSEGVKEKKSDHIFERDHTR